ncbi:uncharacterized protein LOC119301884 [Triticum dicoccoides]|uniref:uncharacterized protein LOC119301884 n=1 Tax=Triticum dicoccoides TaxID=85692 RepID=UPI00188DE884|nr:uncharacterized protein LOC119301884 [Triticum dicoccoides]
MARLSSIPVSLLLLASLASAAASAAAVGQEEGGIKIRVRYPTKEQSRWLNRWAEKHQAQGSGEGFRIRPATDEESAFLNRMSARGAEKTGGRAGYDGRIEFGADHPFGRIVEDAFHSRAHTSKANDEL